jgi:hypothetical protein
MTCQQGTSPSETVSLAYAKGVSGKSVMRKPKEQLSQFPVRLLIGSQQPAVFCYLQQTLNLNLQNLIAVARAANELKLRRTRLSSLRMQVQEQAGLHS